MKNVVLIFFAHWYLILTNSYTGS